MCAPDHLEPHPYHGVRGVLYGIRVAVINVCRSGIPWWRLPAEIVSNMRLRAGNGWVCCGNHGHPAC